MDPRLPGILFIPAKVRDQADVWLSTGFCKEWTITVFIISPIVQYLVIVVNHQMINLVLYLYNTPNLVAKAGIAPAVFRLWAWRDTTSPLRVNQSQLFIIGASGRIWTYESTDLQSAPLGRSGTDAQTIVKHTGTLLISGAGFVSCRNVFYDSA